MERFKRKKLRKNNWALFKTQNHQVSNEEDIEWNGVVRSRWTFEMTYKDAITQAMDMLSEDPRVCWVGYNTLYGRAAGTLGNIAADRIFEMPLAENLMTGAAVGMSLDGRIPVVYFERADFILCALDAIVNHLNVIGQLSDGLHKPACIIRVVVGNSKTPLFTGITHTRDNSSALEKLVAFPVVRLWWSRDVVGLYREALERAKTGVSTILYDFKDQHNAEYPC